MEREDSENDMEHLKDMFENREPVYVDQDGRIHDAKSKERLQGKHPDEAMTRIKPTLWG